MLVFLHAVHAANAIEARMTLEFGMRLPCARVIEQAIQLDLGQATLVIALIHLLLRELLDGKLLAALVLSEPHDSAAALAEQIELAQTLGHALVRCIQLNLVVRHLNLAIARQLILLDIVVAHVVGAIIELATGYIFLVSLLRRRRLG